MQSLEVSGAVRPLQGSLGIKGLVFALWQVLLNVRIRSRRWQHNLSFSDNKSGCQTRECYVITESRVSSCRFYGTSLGLFKIHTLCGSIALCGAEIGYFGK